MLSKEILVRGGPDYFLSNPPRQPKKEIGDYVESQGILVPKRFATLSEALSSGKPFLARSEHPQDYAGASDLFYTVKIDQDTLEETKRLNERKRGDDYRGDGSLSDSEVFLRLVSRLADITQEDFEANLKLLRTRAPLNYCSYMGISTADFLSQVSYSYWEFLPGHNRTIVADNSIPERYHVLTTPSKGGSCGYTIVEKGKIVANSSWKLPPELYKTIPSLVNLYESVRRLERFDSNHCPIMETQLVGQDQYFLQYHRAVGSNPSSFTLDREPEEGEEKATFVRGATPKEGLTLRFNFHTQFDREFEARDEDAGLDYTSHIYREIMARKRKVHFVRAESMYEISAFLAMAPHLTISQLFESPVCIAISRNDRNSLIPEFFGPKGKQRPVDQFDIRVISDGRKAYVKRLG